MAGVIAVRLLTVPLLGELLGVGELGQEALGLGLGGRLVPADVVRRPRARRA